MDQATLQDPFLDIEGNVTTIQEQLKRDESDINKNKSRRYRIAIALCLSLLLVLISGFILGSHFFGQKNDGKKDVVTSEYGVVAADHETCSEIGAKVLGEQGGNAMDAAVAVAFCLGVVNPTSSGIGGGAFMVYRSSADSVATAYDMRETAPMAASQDMFENKETEKVRGPLSIAVPGEVAGLFKAWEKHRSGNVEWKLLLKPSIKLARGGFLVGPHLAFILSKIKEKIMNDTGLESIFTREKGKLLKKGEICYNLKLAETLDAVANNGMKGFYEGEVAENLVKDIRGQEGIIKMEDLQNYEVNVTKAMVVEDVMGYKIEGMWPPSSGTPGFAMVLNVMRGGYKTVDKNLRLHRLIEAIKHMLAARMDLGDPAFDNDIYDVVKRMVSKSYAKEIRRKISDERTYPPEYYLSKYSQLKDQGTSHFCVVDKDRNAVSMTTTLNYAFGSGFMSPSTGIILNNQMADFSIPTGSTGDTLPPAPANFIAPKKRPLSSMMPIIITKDDQLVGAIGGSGGMYIVPAVIQVFLNHFNLNMSPQEAVEMPRIYHMLKPNKVLYEDWKVYNGSHIELEKDTRDFLTDIGHKLVPTEMGAIVQFIVQNKQENSEKTVLTAVGDLRKGGKPAAAFPPPSPPTF